MANVKVTFHDDGLRDLATSTAMRRTLDGMAFTITAHAVPHSGVDTGRLIGSMGHAVKRRNNTLVAQLGSGLGDGVAPVFYSSYNWSPGKPGGRRTRWRGTRPYAKALRELGIRFKIAPGGYES